MLTRGPSKRVCFGNPMVGLVDTAGATEIWSADPPDCEVRQEAHSGVGGLEIATTKRGGRLSNRTWIGATF